MYTIQYIQYYNLYTQTIEIENTETNWIQQCPSNLGVLFGNHRRWAHHCSPRNLRNSGNAALAFCCGHHFWKKILRVNLAKVAIAADRPDSHDGQSRVVCWAAQSEFAWPTHHLSRSASQGHAERLYNEYDLSLSAWLRNMKVSCTPLVLISLYYILYWFLYVFILNKRK